MSKQKEVSTFAGLLIIFGVTVIFFGGAFAYQHIALQNLDKALFTARLFFPDFSKLSK